MMKKLFSKIFNTNNQIKYGGILSYIVLAVNVIVSLLFMPWFTKQLGQENYSIYTLANSLTSIFILDFGLNATSSKFLSKYRADNDLDGEANFLGLITKLYFIIDAVIFSVCVVMFFFLNKIYTAVDESLFPSFRAVFVSVAIYSVVSLPLTTLSGILSSNEKFVFIKTSSLFHKIIQVVFLTIALLLKLDIFFVVLANIGSNLLLSLIQFLYVKFAIKAKINLRFKDKKLLLSIFSFSIWVMITVVTRRLETSFIPSILGMVSTSKAIAIYGVALVVAEYSSLFSSALSGLFLPRITRIEKENDISKINKLVFFVGKIQSVIVSLIFFGFIFCGKEFLLMFYGEDYIGAYLCAIFLMIQYLILSPKLLMESHSYVKNTVKYSAIIKAIFAVIIVGLCFLTGKLFGEIGVCASVGIGTAISYIFVDFFVYYKKQNIDVPHFYLKIHLRTIVISAIFLLLALLLKTFIAIDTLTKLVLSIIIFTYLYILAMFIFLFDQGEKQQIVNLLFGEKIKRFFATYKNIFSYLSTGIIVFACIFCSEPANQELVIPIIVILAAILLPVYFFFYFPLFKNTDTNKYYLLKNCGIWVLFSLFIAAVFSFFFNNMVHPFSYAKIIAVPLICFVIINIFNLKKLINSFLWIMFSITIVSLIFYFAINISGQEFGDLYYSGTQYYKYLFGLYYSIVNLSDRNCSIFWEPGIYASYLCIAIIVSSVFEEKKYKRIIMIIAFVIGLITTKSLAGFILCAFSVAFIIAFKIIKRSKTDIVVAFSTSIILIIVLIFGIILPSVNEDIFNFINNIFQKGTSFSTRILSFRVDFMIFKERPLFGVGAYYHDYFVELTTGAYNVIDSSVSTNGFYIAFFGVYGFILMAMLVALPFTIKMKTSPSILLVAIIIVLLNKEPHMYSFILWVIIFAFIKYGANYKLFGYTDELDMKKCSIWFNLIGK